MIRSTGFGVASALRSAGDHGVEGLSFFFPAEIAVHGVVAAADARGDVAGSVFAEGSLELFEVAEATGGHGVAAIHEGVDEDVG